MQFGGWMLALVGMYIRRQLLEQKLHPMLIVGNVKHPLAS